MPRALRGPLSPGFSGKNRLRALLSVRCRRGCLQAFFVGGATGLVSVRGEGWGFRTFFVGGAMATVGNFRKGCAMRRSDAAPASFGGRRSADVSAAYPRPEPPFSCGYPERGTSERSRFAGRAVGSVRTEPIPAVYFAVVGTVSAVCSAAAGAVPAVCSAAAGAVPAVCSAAVGRRSTCSRLYRSCGAACGVPARSRRFFVRGLLCEVFSAGGFLREVFCATYSAKGDDRRAAGVRRSLRWRRCNAKRAVRMFGQPFFC